MKYLLFILALLPVSCGLPREVTVTDPSTGVTLAMREVGNLGGQTYAHAARTKAGTLTITTRNNMEKSFADGVTAGVAAYGMNRQAAVSLAEVGRDQAIAIGAQKADVAGQGIAAGVEKAKISADVIKTTTIPK